MTDPTVKKSVSLTPLILLLILIAIGIGLVYIEDNAQFVHSAIGTFLGLGNTSPPPSSVQDSGTTASPTPLPASPTVTATPEPTATPVPPVIRQRYSVGNAGDDD